MDTERFRLLVWKLNIIRKFPLGAHTNPLTVYGYLLNYFFFFEAVSDPASCNKN